MQNVVCKIICEAKQLPLLDRRGGTSRKGAPGWLLNQISNRTKNHYSDLEQPPRLRLRRSHPSYPGGAITQSFISRLAVWSDAQFYRGVAADSMMLSAMPRALDAARRRLSAVIQKLKIDGS